MELAFQKSSGSEAGSVEVSESAFGVAFNEPLIHQVVTAYLAGARRGTRAQKNRSAARGGGAKPYRQKGTGRGKLARHHATGGCGWFPHGPAQ